MRETHEVWCCMCQHVLVVATVDDESPTCDTCQGTWTEVLAVRAITTGEMDHLIPGLQEGGEEDGSEEEAGDG